MYQLESSLYGRDCTNIVGVRERGEGVLGPNGGHGSERSAESSSGKGGSSDSSDHFESGICVKCARSIRGVSVFGKTVDCAVIEAIKARDNIILKLGCGSEAFITKATPPYSHQNHSASFPSPPPIPESIPSPRGLQSLRKITDEQQQTIIYLLHLLPTQALQASPPCRTL